MSTLHLHQTTTATPEQFLAALTDFGPDRSTIFPNSQDQHLQVHSRSATDADVTEGTGGVWERLHYDWSDPTRIVITDTDSNVWGGRSGYLYTLTARPDGLTDNGLTDIEEIVVRDGKNLKGRVIGFVIGTVGKRTFAKGLVSTVKAIEARNTTTRQAA
jgi:hypothetical protein